MDKSTPKAKGLRTGIQAIIGTVIAFVTGLWALPEVQLYVSEFLRNEGVALVILLLGLIGVSAGLVSFIQNKLGK